MVKSKRVRKIEKLEKRLEFFKLLDNCFIFYNGLFQFDLRLADFKITKYTRRSRITLKFDIDDVR